MYIGLHYSIGLIDLLRRRLYEVSIQLASARFVRVSCLTVLLDRAIASELVA